MSTGTAPGPLGGDYDLSNPVGSFTDVVRRVVARPAGFFSGIPRRGNYLSPLVFVLICIEISTILGGLLRLAWQAETMGGVRFQGIDYHRRYDRALHLCCHCTPFGDAVRGSW